MWAYIHIYIYIFIFIYTYLFQDYFRPISVGFKLFTIVSTNWDLFPFFTCLVVAAIYTKITYVTFLTSKLFCVVRSD